MTTREAMHRFLVLFVDVERRDEAEECLSLLLEVAQTRSDSEHIKSFVDKFCKVNDTEPAPAPDICQIHDEDDVIPWRICGHPLPCPDHSNA